MRKAAQKDLPALRRLRRSNALPDPTEARFLGWSRFEYRQEDPQGRTIADVLNHEHTGFTITGVLDADEIDRALRRAKDLDVDWYGVGYGRTWGTPVNQSWDGDRTEYLEQVQMTCQVYTDIFGFDIKARLTEAFSSASGPFSVRVADEGGRPYLPGSIREMKAGAGGLPAHTGNEFFEIGGEAPLRHLRETTQWKDSLSFFLMLQPPHRGGELRLYDLTWDEHPEFRGFNNFDRDDRPLDRFEAAALRAQPGDLVWFRGGDQWHRVSPVRGARSRVTFGGFMAPLLGEETLVFWS